MLLVACGMLSVNCDDLVHAQSRVLRVWKSCQIQQTSDALEAVVERFVADIVKLPASQRVP